jgi:hypothetical protein
MDDVMSNEGKLAKKGTPFTLSRRGHPLPGRCMQKISGWMVWLRAGTLTFLRADPILQNPATSTMAVTMMLSQQTRPLAVASPNRAASRAVTPAVFGLQRPSLRVQVGAQRCSRLPQLSYYILCLQTHTVAAEALGIRATFDQSV